MDIYISWAAVGLGTLANMILGFAWYSPTLFARPWTKAVGLSDDQMKSRTVGPWVATVILAFVTSLAVAYFFNYMTYDYSVMNGVRLGLELSGGVLLPALLSIYVFQRRPLGLFFIDFGYRLVGLVVIGAIVGGLGI